MFHYNFVFSFYRCKFSIPIIMFTNCIFFLVQMWKKSSHRPSPHSTTLTTCKTSPNTWTVHPTPPPFSTRCQPHCRITPPLQPRSWHPQPPSTTPHPTCPPPSPPINPKSTKTTTTAKSPTGTSAQRLFLQPSKPPCTTTNSSALPRATNSSTPPHTTTTTTTMPPPPSPLPPSKCSCPVRLPWWRHRC